MTAGRRLFPDFSSQHGARRAATHGEMDDSVAANSVSPSSFFTADPAPETQDRGLSARVRHDSPLASRADVLCGERK